VNTEVIVNGQKSSRVRDSLALWVLGGTIGSIGMSVFGTIVGSTPSPATVTWWYFITLRGTLLADVLFYFFVVLLVTSWIGVGLHARRGTLLVKHCWIILCLWGVPLLLGPPMFGRDLYSYVAQGLIAHQGMNPYHVTPEVLGAGPNLDSIASVWRNTIAPYGPLFLSLSRGLVSLAGHSLVVQVLLMRSLEIIGFVLVMVFLPRLARQQSVNPGLALWLVALSPLALTSLIASGHNDALMIGLVVAGVSLALEGRLAIGFGICAVAASIKLPAAAAILFLGVDEFRRADRTRRLRILFDAILLPIAIIVGITLAAGYGWTWLGPQALKVPGLVRALMTPSVSLGSFAYSILDLVGVHVASHTMVSIFQVMCTVLTLSGCAWLLVNAQKLNVVRALGLALLLFSVGSPTLWPWYLMWGISLLAATSAQRSRLLVILAGFAIFLVDAAGTPTISGWGVYVTGPLVIAGVIWFVKTRHWEKVVAGAGL